MTPPSEDPRSAPLSGTTWSLSTTPPSACATCVGTATVEEPIYHHDHPDILGTVPWPCPDCAPAARRTHALNILGAGEPL